MARGGIGENVTYYYYYISAWHTVILVHSKRKDETREEEKLQVTNPSESMLMVFGIPRTLLPATKHGRDQISDGIPLVNTTINL